jgi:methylmalonyl-CoA mutase
MFVAKNSSSQETPTVLRTPSLAEWEDLAAAALKNRSLEDLARINEDGITINALYSSASHHPALDDTLSAAATRRWMIAQYLEPAEDPKILNKMILDELTGGTERIIFPGAQKLKVVSKAMKGVKANAIVLSFDQPADPATAMAQLLQIWDDQNTEPKLARGALGIAASASFWDNLASFMTAYKSDLDRYPHLRLAKISGVAAHREGATVAQELAVILAIYTIVMRCAEEEDFDLSGLLTRLEFEVAIDADLYGGIAKARALRAMLSRMITAMGLDNADLSQRLHGITSDRMLARIDPETNMLRTGTAMLSMALSGLGVITNRPHDWLTGSSPLSRRIARNVHHLLADESQLAHIADPAQGSYFIDTLTSELIEKAWQLFQEIESAGGYDKALDNGMIAAWCETAAARRKAGSDQGKDALLGVSAHPAPGAQHLPDVIDDHAAGHAFKRGGDVRPAASWEKLVTAFATKKVRCLMLDVGADQSAKDVKRWIDIFGLEAAAMSAENKDDAIKLIQTAKPDLVVAGDKLMLADKDGAGLKKTPIIRKANDFKADIIAEMTSILTVLNEGEAS